MLNPFVYLIRNDDGVDQFYLESFSVDPRGGKVLFTLEPQEAVSFANWEEAAAVASFIVFHVDESFSGCLEISKFIL